MIDPNLTFDGFLGSAKAKRIGTASIGSEAHAIVLKRIGWDYVSVYYRIRGRLFPVGHRFSRYYKVADLSTYLLTDAADDLIVQLDTEY